MCDRKPLTLVSVQKSLFSKGTSKHRIISFEERMESLQAERRALLFGSCRRMNSNFSGFSEEPHLNSFYSNTYKVCCWNLISAIYHKKWQMYQSRYM